MKILNTFFKVFILFQLTISKCDQGCLKCSIQDQCLFCDVTQNYFVFGFSCKQQKVENCYIQDQEGNCLGCDSGYYLDQLTRKCVQVMEETQILNCEYYSTFNECLKCLNGFYLNEGKCEAIPNAIENCEDYKLKDSTTCEKCSKNYILSENAKQCTKISNLENCNTHQIFTCLKCKQNYILNKNYYIQNSVDNINMQQQLLLQHQSQYKQGHYQEQCIKYSIPNCSEIKTQNSCSICEQGYYLDSNHQCSIVPQQPIKNCLTYKTINQCIGCKQGYFLQDQVTCTEVQAIENCELYAGNFGYSTCIQCQKDFFLQGTCQQRSNKDIANCKQYHKEKDQCQICGEKYVLSGDGLKCFLKIANCESHLSNQTTKDTENIMCENCSEKHYLSQDKLSCILGTIENCLLYQQTENVCQKCDFQFYLDNQNCRPHKQIENCQIYSNSIQNSCEQCLDNFVLFSVSNFCIQSNSITNCKIYESVNVCSQCDEGYAVNIEDSACIIYEEDLNCQKVNQGICTLCKPGYVLWQLTNKCIQNHDYYNACNETSIQNNQINCISCNQNSYLQQIYDQTVCVYNNIKYLPEIKVENCEVFKIVDNKLQCQQCQLGFYLDINLNECKDICEHTIVLIQLEFDTNTTRSKYINTCEDITQPNCQYAIQSNQNATKDIICTKCKQNSIQYIDKTQSILGKTHVVEYNNDQLLISYQNHSQAIYCQEDTQISNINTIDNSEQILNCDLYEKKNVNQVDFYFCIRCKLGFTGIVQDNYITSCDQQINDCNTSTIYKSLLNPSQIQPQQQIVYLQNFNSCHRCNNNKIPTLFINYQSNFTLQQFSLTVDPPQNEEIGDGIFQKCLQTTQTDLSLQNEQQINSIPTNCAFLIYDISKQKSADLYNQPSITCGACKPGYSPSFASSIISKCEQIDNCNLQSQKNVYYNQCGECMNNFVFGWNETTNSYNFQKCIANSVINCESFSSDRNQCMSCKIGYYLNRDNQCEDLKSPYCQQDQSYFTKNTFSNQNTTLNINIVKAQKMEGCQICEDNFIKVQVQTSTCLESSYLKNQLFVQNTQFIENCISYYISGDQLKCKQCFGSSIPQQGNEKCIDMNFELQGCELAINDTTCYQCVQNKVLVQGKCKNQLIPNCKIYQNGSVQQTCAQCVDGYYLFQSECKQGSIQNCEIYNSEVDCQKCKQNHQLISVLGGQSYCFPIPLSWHCKNFNDTFQVKNLNCLQCSENYVKSDNFNNIPKQQCASVNQVMQCLEYDFDNSFSSSSLKCKKCIQSYFVDEDNLCKKRINFDINCVGFVQDQDLCAECREGYFLSEDQKTCERNPNGIIGCVKYLNSSTCSQCDIQYYMESNSNCLELLEEDKIENCLAYKAPKKCMLCIEDFFLKNEQCVLIEARNCVTVKDEKNCSSCQLGYGLKQEENFTNCVEKTDPNCESSQNTYPFKCIQCYTDFYPDKDGFCQTISKQIEYCLYYENADICKQCVQGKVLSLDRTKCLSSFYLQSIIDNNCTDLKLIEQQECQICKPGYYFNTEKQCQKCEDSEKCFLCDPKDPSICYLCQSNFYMSKEQKCISNQPQILENEQSYIRRLVIYLFLVLLIINQNFIISQNILQIIFMSKIMNQDAQQNTFPQTFEQMDILGQTLAHNIDINLNNIIEEVKKQKQDMTKLNSELKNSRCVIDKRNFEDIKSRSDNAVILRQFKREREFAQQQIYQLVQINQSNERKLQEKDRLIEELKFRLIQSQKKQDLQQEKLDEQKIEIARLNLKMESDSYDRSDAKTSNSSQSYYQNELRNFKGKLREQNLENLDIKKQMDELNLKLEQANQKNQYMELELQRNSFQNNEQKNQGPDNKLKSQLIYDFHLLTRIRSDMNSMIESLEEQNNQFINQKILLIKILYYNTYNEYFFQSNQLFAIF